MEQIIKKISSLWNKQKLRTVKPNLYIPIIYSKIISRYFYCIFAVLILAIVFLFQDNIVSAIVGAFFLGIFYLLFRFWRKCQQAYLNGIDFNLQYMIVSNRFYDSEIINGREIITNYLALNYMETENSIAVVAFKRGDNFSRKTENLDIEIESALGLPLSEKTIYPDKVEYYLIKHKPERKHISTFLKEDSSLKIEVYGDFVINLRDNFSMLVSGSSGAGKSYFTYYWLTRFISQTIDGKHAKLFAIDPKQSDLYKLCQISGMPLENYGTTNREAFKILRSYLNEMERRMAIYNKSSAFDSVAIDIGLEPALLIIEEYSSLVASMDTKEKKDFENMVAIIAQKARSLSLGICIVMQQPRSELLGTNIKEQLVNSVFLGSPSKESAMMMFGTTDVPKVTGKGIGLCSIERGTPREFQSPIFDGNVFDIILPVWKYVAKSYIEEKNTGGLSD